MTAPDRPLPYSWPEVKVALQAQMRGVLDALGIRDAERDGLVTPLNPRRADKNRGSFVIWMTGEAVGAWQDYAIKRKGDVFDLIEYLGGLQGKMDAYWWALAHLGWARGEIRTASQKKLDDERAAADRAAAETRARHDLDQKAQRAFDLFISAAKEIRGTPVWTYLTEARGVPLERLPARPSSIRYLPALDHIDRDTGEVTTWPCMVTGMSRASDGKVRAVHRTWLRPDGSGKADVAKPKMMWGDAKGCAMRLWKGAGDLTPEAAARAGVVGPLILTEGIEDGLTAAIARPESRVWAPGSLSLMALPEWPACASAVVLVADNDWHEPQAVEAFAKVEAHWRGLAKGRAVKVVRAAAGKDLNDWARGEG